ncbi:hypothetical protein [Oceaniglobus ichthyenteri]|uniref:hypothetical protein n=1 Tax=Oceaniglobus ichthyenteri TaxID=2136177 RepID=UPI0013DE6F38|nr:hypothetical protein [Oceaniglobus ichthyenteri]
MKFVLSALVLGLSACGETPAKTTAAQESLTPASANFTTMRKDNVTYIMGKAK